MKNSSGNSQLFSCPQLIALLVFVALSSAGCAGWAEFTPPASSQEMREGPGLFSGDDGEFGIDRELPLPESEEEKTRREDEEERP